MRFRVAHSRWAGTDLGLWPSQEFRKHHRRKSNKTKPRSSPSNGFVLLPTCGGGDGVRTSRFISRPQTWRDTLLRRVCNFECKLHELHPKRHVKAGNRASLHSGKSSAPDLHSRDREVPRHPRSMPGKVTCSFTLLGPTSKH